MNNQSLSSSTLNQRPKRTMIAYSEKDKLCHLQKKNTDLAKCNASLTMQLAQLQDSLLKAMEDRVLEQEQRIKVEKKLMESMSALDVLKVEVGKRMPVLEAIAEHLMDTAGLFNQLLSLDYGEILLERLYGQRQDSSWGKSKIQIHPILEIIREEPEKEK